MFGVPEIGEYKSARSANNVIDPFINTQMIRIPGCVSSPCRVTRLAESILKLRWIALSGLGGHVADKRRIGAPLQARRLV